MGVRSALLVLTAIVALPHHSQAQSAGKVVDEYLKAIGGKAAVEKIVSAELSGRVTAGDGASGTFTQRTQQPRQFSLSLSWGDTGWRGGFNGRAAWHDERPDGVRTLYGAAAARVKAEALFANTRYLAADHVIELSVRGREQVRGRPAVALVAVTPDGLTRTLFFDAESNLLVKDEQPTDAGVDERFFDDYRRVGGVMEPHRIEWRRNGQTLQLTVERITHNATLDAQAFDVPAPPVDGLDVDGVLAAARRGEENATSARASYIYVQTTTLASLDAGGRVAREDSWTFDVLHLDGGPVSRLIKKGGEPLSDAEQRDQDKRVQRIVQEHERQRVAGRPAVRPSEPSSPGSVIYQAPLFSVTAWLPSYLRMSEFSHLRRERLGERAVLVVEFQPKRGAAPTREFERQIARMAGALWIDEASQQVVRIESSFTDTYNQIVPGSASRMERTRVDNAVWLPLRSETHLRRTRGFGSPMQLADTSQFSGHKKFGVATDSAIELPDAGR